MLRRVMDKALGSIKSAFYLMVHKGKETLKQMELKRWITNPPTQEYVLPMFFGTKPSILLWLSRKLPKNDLVLYSQYFHPSFLIENTMRVNFMKYHGKLIPLAGIPPWYDTRAEKSELYQCSKIVEALLDNEREKTPKAFWNLMFKRPNYNIEHESLLNYAYEILSKKYQQENPSLLPILEKEKNWLLLWNKLSRDQKREIELMRRHKLYQRIEELKNVGVDEEQINLFKAILNESKNCYTYYVMFKEYARINQSEANPVVDTYKKLGFDRFDSDDNSGIDPEEQFAMKFDEYYQIQYETHETEDIGNEKTQTISANL